MGGKRSGRHDFLPGQRAARQGGGGLVARGGARLGMMARGGARRCEASATPSVHDAADAAGAWRLRRRDPVGAGGDRFQARRICFSFCLMNSAQQCTAGARRGECARWRLVQQARGDGAGEARWAPAATIFGPSDFFLFA